MNYSITIASLIVTISGWLGISTIFTQTEVATFIDNVIQIAGFIGIWYGRYTSDGRSISVFGTKK